MLRFFVYMLRCADRSYYVGVTTDLKSRVAQHQQGYLGDAYTFRRRPVHLVWSESFPTEWQARERERQLKGWRRSKKEALIPGGVDRGPGGGCNGSAAGEECAEPTVLMERPSTSLRATESTMRRQTP
jgi:predicted GIY-YIG superfamily endonuclease